MDDLHLLVFDLFHDYQVGIIGSATLDPRGAKDIDVLFLVKEEFEKACQENQKKWNGWDAWNGHVRICNLNKFGKKIQMIHISSVDTFEKHPHSVLLRDGSWVHEGVYFVKPEGWKYEKWPKG